MNILILTKVSSEIYYIKLISLIPVLVHFFRTQVAEVAGQHGIVSCILRVAENLKKLSVGGW